MSRRLQRFALRRVSRWVGRASDDRLERLMAGRLRDRILAAIFRGMERRFDPRRGAGVDAALELWVGGRQDGRRDTWQVVMADGHCRVADSLERDPDLTIEIDGAAFLKLVTANATGPELFVKGELKLDGDLVLAYRLPRLFRAPRP